MSEATNSSELDTSNPTANLRRSGRSKTASQLYGDEFQDEPIFTRKSPIKNSNSTVAKASTVRKSARDTPVPIAENYAQEHRSTKNIRTQYESDWLPFTLSPKSSLGELLNEKQLFVTFVTERTEEDCSLQVSSETSIKSPLLAQPKSNMTTAATSLADQPNNQRNGANRYAEAAAGSSNRYETRRNRKQKKNFDEELELEVNRSKKKTKSKPPTVQKSKLTPLQSQKGPSGLNEDFLDKILSAAINAQSAQKEGKSSVRSAKTATQNSLKGKSSATEKSRAGKHSRSKNFSSKPDMDLELANPFEEPVPTIRTDYFTSAKLIKEDNTLVLHHSQRPPVTLKYTRPPTKSPSLPATSQIWNIGKELPDSAAADTVIDGLEIASERAVDRPTTDLNTEEARLRAFILDQVKSVRPGILVK